MNFPVYQRIRVYIYSTHNKSDLLEVYGKQIVQYYRRLNSSEFQRVNSIFSMSTTYQPYLLCLQNYIFFYKIITSLFSACIHPLGIVHFRNMC